MLVRIERLGLSLEQLLVSSRNAKETQQ
jgi:hypothetical protein